MIRIGIRMKPNSAMVFQDSGSPISGTCSTHALIFPIRTIATNRTANENNTGRWLPLNMDNPVLARQFASLEEILFNTRLAADAVGATPMDRPEWVAKGPGGLYADPEGRLFIETDGGQKEGMNNQLIVADINSGDLKRLFSGVPGCEITGVAITPDRQTMFINVQHPGNGDPDRSNFPVPGAGGAEIPRDATIVLRRNGGGIIGS